MGVSQVGKLSGWLKILQAQAETQLSYIKEITIEQV